MMTCQNYINGQWVSAQSGVALESRNPAETKWNEPYLSIPTLIWCRLLVLPKLEQRWGHFVGAPISVSVWRWLAKMPKS